MQFVLEHHIIPDGISSIVELTVKCEFTVPTTDGPKHAENVIIEIAQRLTGKQESEIREVLAIQQASRFWFADGPRPEESAPP